jgi:predicted transcriptional regulator
MYFDVAQLTCDINSRMILSAIETRPRSAREIAEMTNLSISRCYRMIREMEQLNILSRTESDGRVTFYSSNLRSVELRLETDHIGLTVDFRDGSRTELKLGPEDLERSPEGEFPQDLLIGDGSEEPSTIS